MSAATGVEQIDPDFDLHVKAPLIDRMENPLSSVVWNQMCSFEKMGAAGWGENTVEWLVVYLLTELAVMPNTAHSGLGGLSLTSALQKIVLHLVRILYPTVAFPSLKRGIL